MTPGTQPQSHSKNVIKIEPQPLSKTAKGGQIIDIKTRQILINLFFDCDVIIRHYFPKKVTITSFISQTFMTSIHKA